MAEGGCHNQEQTERVWQAWRRGQVEVDRHGPRSRQKHYIRGGQVSGRRSHRARGSWRGKDEARMRGKGWGRMSSL